MSASSWVGGLAGRVVGVGVGVAVKGRAGLCGGSDNQTAAARLDCAEATVGKWRRRFVSGLCGPFEIVCITGTSARRVVDDLVRALGVDSGVADSADCPGFVRTRPA